MSSRHRIFRFKLIPQSVNTILRDALRRLTASVCDNLISIHPRECNQMNWVSIDASLSMPGLEGPDKLNLTASKSSSLDPPVPKAHKYFASRTR
ncbi:hypothetical protein TNCV_4154071 [Trichonephila clavipes]|nr:hypothetical protein TNCV_4154071 [Trichonephila clavipes]